LVCCWSSGPWAVWDLHLGYNYGRVTSWARGDSRNGLLLNHSSPRVVLAVLAAKEVAGDYRWKDGGRGAGCRSLDWLAAGWVWPIGGGVGQNQDDTYGQRTAIRASTATEGIPVGDGRGGTRGLVSTDRPHATSADRRSSAADPGSRQYIFYGRRPSSQTTSSTLPARAPRPAYLPISREARADPRKGHTGGPRGPRAAGAERRFVAEWPGRDGIAALNGTGDTIRGDRSDQRNPIGGPRSGAIWSARGRGGHDAHSKDDRTTRLMFPACSVRLMRLCLHFWPWCRLQTRE